MTPPVLNPLMGNWLNVLLDWSTYAGLADTFNVYRKRQGESHFSLITSGITQQTIHSQHESNTGDVVSYYVTAVLAGTESPASNIEIFTVPAKPPRI